MIFDCNHALIAKWYSIDEVVPYEQYTSGAKDKDNPVYKVPVNSSSNPVLALDFEVKNEYGFGLDKGYYEIAADSDYSCLMFMQAGKIAAKIPVVKQELIHEYGSDFEWSDDKDKSAPNSASKDLTEEIAVTSKAAYTKVYTARELKKRKKKYQKGKDPSTYFHSAVYLEYDRELELYRVIWEKYNTRLIGIMKLK